MLMKLDELNKHIQGMLEQFFTGEFGSKLTKQIGDKVDEALKPIEGDMTKRQLELIDLVKERNEAANGKSLLNSKRERTKGEAFGAVVRALRNSKNDIGMAAKYLKKFGYDDISELMAEHAQTVEKAMTAGDPE